MMTVEGSDAGKERYLRELRQIASQGGDLDARTASGCRPLHWAIKHDSLEIVKLLLSAGADVNAPNDYGNTPLHWAASSGNIDIIAVLLAAGANINATTISNGETPLHFAAKSGKQSAYDFLVASGADINVRNFGRTAGEILDAKNEKATYAARIEKQGTVKRER